MKIMPQQFTFLKLFAIPLLFLFQSCNLLTNPRTYGTGAMSVTMNGTRYDLTDVKGHEYLGFFCGGNISGKEFGLGLGVGPNTGDTLHLSFRNQEQSFFRIFAHYNDVNSVPDSGVILITGRSGRSVKGVFECIVVVAKDTFQFRNGIFDVEFVPTD